MKDPAFLFYSSDFLSGVQDLTMEERGQYITLLCLQHQKGRLTDKMIRLAVADAAADVMAKFQRDPDGLFFNERLEAEIQKRKVFSDKQRVRAKNGWKKRKNIDAAADAVAYAAAMPIIENINRNKIQEVKYSEVSTVFPIEQCLEIALLDERFIDKNRISRSDLRLFNDFLEKGGIYEHNPAEYKKYFRNWRTKTPTSKPLKEFPV